jgi:hypothetical protein
MKTTNPNTQAQNYARKYLLNKYRKEYNEVYRAEVIRLGGKLAPTKEEMIAKLQAKIAELEAEDE